MTSFFSAEGCPISIKFHRLVQNDMSTAVIWSKSKPEVDFQYGARLGEFRCMSSQNHVSHCRVLPPSEINVMIPEPLATLQGERIPSAILKIVFRHMQFGLWQAAAFVSSSIHLLYYYYYYYYYYYCSLAPLMSLWITFLDWRYSRILRRFCIRSKAVYVSSPVNRLLAMYSFNVDPVVRQTVPTLLTTQHCSLSLSNQTHLGLQCHVYIKLHYNI